jgi:hypothetical protein
MQVGAILAICPLPSTISVAQATGPTVKSIFGRQQKSPKIDNHHGPDDRSRYFRRALLQFDWSRASDMSFF